MQCKQEDQIQPPSEQEVRASRATMVESISHKLTSLFTSVMGHMDMALISLSDPCAVANRLDNIKKAVHAAQGWNSKLISLMDECRREQAGQTPSLQP